MKKLHKNDDDQNQQQFVPKQVKFRSKSTKQIISQVDIPSFVQLKNGRVNDIQQFSHSLRMLYLDVVNRGFYPLKSKQSDAKGVFRTDQQLRKNIEGNQPNNQYVAVTSLTNSEALGTIWRCLGRQIGLPIKKYNLREVQKELGNQLAKLRSEASLKNNFIKTCKSDLTNYHAKQSEIQDLEFEIGVEMQKILQKFNQDELRENQQRVQLVKVLEQQILDLQNEVFVASLAGIRQCDQNSRLVQFIFEQSYPTIKISIQKAKEMLGEQLYQSKWTKYHDYHGEAQNTEIITIVCHKCLTYLNNHESIWQCEDKLATSILSHSLLTDPYIYNNTVLNEMGTCSTGNNKFMHQYLCYYNLSNFQRTAVCNRYFCQKCAKQDINIKQNGNCGFCQGTCQCRRCQKMDTLTKLMALYLQQEGDLLKVINKFKMKFDGKILNIQSKKQLKLNSQIYQNMEEYIQCFISSGIFIEQQKIGKFNKIQFYQGDINENDYLQLQRYRSSKLKAQQKKAKKQQFKNEEKGSSKNKSNKKKKAQLEERQKIIQQPDQESESKQKVREQIDCYYQDSSS